MVIFHNDVSLPEGNPQKKTETLKKLPWVLFDWQWDFVDDFSVFDPFGGLWYARSDYLTNYRPEIWILLGDGGSYCFRNINGNVTG